VNPRTKKRERRLNDSGWDDDTASRDLSIGC